MIIELQIEDFEKKLIDLMGKYKLPGMSIAISHEDKIIYSKGFGYADIVNKIEATPTTPYRIASLTKPISSIIILQLVEQGIIDLDKSIAEYIPNYVGLCEKNKRFFEEQEVEINGEMVSLAFQVEGYNFERENITIRHHLQQTIINEPGEEYRYNGLLFGLLGIAVDFQVEEKFIGLVRKTLETLEMNDSLPCQEDESKPEILERLAKPYRLNDDREIVPANYPQKNNSSSAGIISTVLDYLKFDKALNKNKLISKETKEMAFTNPINSKGKILPYGLGFFVKEMRDVEGKIVWHYGHWPTFSSLYLKLLAKNLTLVIFVNSDGLSHDFGLGDGNIGKSPFAKAFLDLFGK